MASTNQNPTTTVIYNSAKCITKSSDRVDYVMETFTLDGEYAIEAEYLNEAVIGGDDYYEGVELCKAVYACGNILYKKNEPKVWDYIKLIILATYENNLPVNVDRSVRDRVQKMGGTICPTRDTIFAYDGKLFVLYGRYIYGYDAPYVRFVNQNVKKADTTTDSEEDYDNDDSYEDYDNDDSYEDEKDLPASLNEAEIVLPTITYKKKYAFDKYLNDYNYSFSIIDASSQVLLAFGLYR